MIIINLKIDKNGLGKGENTFIVVKLGGGYINPCTYHCFI